MKTLALVFIQLSFAFTCISQIVFISGEVKNLGENKEVSVFYYNNPIEWVQETAEKVSIDSKGNFSMRFLWNKAMHADLLIGDEHSDLFLIPGDSIHLLVNYKNFDSTINYSGKGGEDNNYMAAELLQEFDKKTNAYRKFKDGDKFKFYVDSIMNTEKEFYKKHSTPGLNKELKNYEESNIKYRYVNPKWMFKVDYDPSTKKLHTKTFQIAIMIS